MSSDHRKILYVSCCENGLFGLEKLVSNGHSNDIAVLTISRVVAEVAQVSGYVDFLAYCTRLKLPIRVMESYKVSDEDIGWMRSNSPDLLFVNGWNRLLPEEVLNVPRYGSFGVHAGHPPRGRGRAPIAWSLINGLRDLEVYLFRLTPGADDGDIVAMRRVEITIWDDARTLYDKVMLSVAYLYEDALPRLLVGDVTGRPQPCSGATYNPPRRPDDGVIDWASRAENIYNFVRGQSAPYPGAFTFHYGRKIEVTSGHPFDHIQNFGAMISPGTILEVLPSGLLVATGSSPFLIREGIVDGFSMTKPTGAWRNYFVPGETFSNE